MNLPRKNFITNNQGFTCLNCQATVPPHPTSCRNHCPFCLYSLHVDLDTPGDRASTCHGLMKPLGLEGGSRKGHLGQDLLHECTLCKKRLKNLLAEDDDWKQTFLIAKND